MPQRFSIHLHKSFRWSITLSVSAIRYPTIRQPFRSFAAGCSTEASTSSMLRACTTENENSAAKNRLGSSSRWVTEVAKELSRDLASSKRRFAVELSKKSAYSEVIRYAVRDNYHSLLSYTLQFLEAVDSHSTGYRGDDQFFAIIIMLAARGMEHYTVDAPLADSVEAVSLFHSLSMLFERLPSLGNDSCAAWVYLLDRIEKWADIRSIDERSSDIDRTVVQIQRKLTQKLHGWRYMRNRLLFSDRAAKVINDRARSVLGGDFREYHIQQPASYDKSLSLVDELREPADEHTYLGSPFVSLGILPEKYAEKFKEQLSTESRHCLKVRNICRNSTKCPAEDLVRQWQWRETLEKCLAEHINQLQQYPLKAYLSILDPSECACLMLSSLLVICSQGQELVPCSQVEYALAEPILDVIHQKFTDKLIEDKENLFLELFNEYIRYFLDATLSRCYTPREWWIRCTRKAKIDPEFRLPLADFHSSVRRDLGSFLLRVVLEACIFTSSGCSVNAFTLRNVTLQEESVLCDDGRLQLCKMVKLSRRMLDLFMHHQFEWLLFPTEHLPIKVPPRPWIDCGGGGPSYLKPSYVLRDLYEYRDVSVNTEVQRRLSKRSQGRPVFDALNDLGSTPWRINKPVLDILLEVFKMTADSSKADMLAKLSFPLRSDTVVVPDYIATFGANKKVEEIPTEEWRRYSKSKYDAIKLKNELNSLWYWLMYRLVMAEHFRDDILFLPHNMDFRGRVYPISPYLSHMGDDINRSLLLFAQGKRLGTDGFRWLKLHCINLTGHMKRSSIEDRIKASDILLPKMIASAKDPLHGERWWINSDDPWQTLAACLEIKNAIESGNPTSYVSCLPIHQDGSCNGLQHYAALGRDRQGGAEVNLLPGDSPSDVYSSVAQRVEEKRIADENGRDEAVKELLLAMRKALPDAVPRKVIKQTVMTTVYGVTMFGAVLQIKRQLKGLGINDEDSVRFARYLAQKTFASLNDAFTSSTRIKNWLRRSAAAIVKLMRPVEWVTPLGLPVVQPYLSLSERHGKLCLIPKLTKQVNAFPPNFVHSLDSTHMMLTALHCRRLGITFAAVHDCYWTHASTADIMNVICREQFIHLHKQPIVEELGKFVRKKYLPSRLRRVMERDEIKEFEDVFTPELPDGKLDIEEIRESIYFFS